MFNFIRLVRHYATIEGVMDKIYRPTKEQVRSWLMHRALNPTPPPGMEQIRRELGWKRVRN